MSGELNKGNDANRDREIQEEIDTLLGFVFQEVTKAMDKFNEEKKPLSDTLVEKFMKSKDFLDQVGNNGSLLKKQPKEGVDAKSLENTIEALNKRYQLTNNEADKIRRDFKEKFTESQEIRSGITRRHHREVLVGAIGSIGSITQQVEASIINTLLDQNIKFPESMNLNDPDQRKNLGSEIKAHMMSKKPDIFKQISTIQENIGKLEQQQSALDNWNKFAEKDKTEYKEEYGEFSDIEEAKRNLLSKAKEDSKSYNKALNNFVENKENLESIINNVAIKINMRKELKERIPHLKFNAGLNNPKELNKFFSAHEKTIQDFQAQGGKASDLANMLPKNHKKQSFDSKDLARLADNVKAATQNCTPIFDKAFKEINEARNKQNQKLLSEQKQQQIQKALKSEVYNYVQKNPAENSAIIVKKLKNDFAAITSEKDKSFDKLLKNKKGEYEDLSKILEQKQVVAPVRNIAGATVAESSTDGSVKIPPPVPPKSPAAMEKYRALKKAKTEVTQPGPDKETAKKLAQEAAAAVAAKMNVSSVQTASNSEANQKVLEENNSKAQKLGLEAKLQALAGKVKSAVNKGVEVLVTKSNKRVPSTKRTKRGYWKIK